MNLGRGLQDFASKINDSEDLNFFATEIIKNGNLRVNSEEMIATEEN